MSPISKKHLIIGGLGSVGKHLQRVLLDQGKEVVVMDRITDQRKVDQHLHHKSVEYVPFDLAKAEENSERLLSALHHIETVYSVVTPDVQHGTVRQFRHVNHRGVEALVRACSAAPSVASFVYASSIAVTNHLIPSVNQSEADPLPDMSTYTNWYDTTKRLGETAVLASNDPARLHTCSLRFGGILASPTDYSMRNALETGTTHRHLWTLPYGARLDYQSGTDVASALARAHDKLLSSSDDLAGTALFVTHDKSNESPRVTEVFEYIGESMGWKSRTVPQPVVDIVRHGRRAQYAVQSLLAVTAERQDQLPGMPPHVFMDIVNHEQTFDNTLACLLYTSPSPRDLSTSRMPSSA